MSTLADAVTRHLEWREAYKMRVINSTAMCLPLKTPAPLILYPTDVEAVVVHRTSLASKGRQLPGGGWENPTPVPDTSLAGVDIARAFSNQAMGTGRRTPYHVLIRANGDVEQLLPLMVQGAHAVGWNWRSWGVAVAGNWDETEIPDRLWLKLLDVLAVLAVPPRKVVGHTELTCAAADPTKRCPGKHANLDHLRLQVTARMPDGSTHWDIRQRLAYVTGAGFTL